VCPPRMARSRPVATSQSRNVKSFKADRAPSRLYGPASGFSMRFVHVCR
jgi:hypothetical protein